MAFAWHDGHLKLEGFSGYNRAEEDPNGVSPDGNNADLYERQAFEPSYEQLQVVYRYESGQISREDAEIELDILADKQSL